MSAHLIKSLDNLLLDLTWSLWTELGVAGVEQKHQNVLILLEELIIFTSVLAAVDPRLRDESLDWCSQFYHFISISRLKSLMKNMTEPVVQLFSKYASSLNNICKAGWPVFIATAPFKVHLSHKSILRSHASPALLNIRARALFGTGARADIITFFLCRPDVNFAIAEVSEVGYSKRNLAEILDDLHCGNLLDRFLQGNQQRYQLRKNSPLFQILKPIPEYVPSWYSLFKVLLALRDCIHRTEHYAESTKVVELCNCIKVHEKSFQKLKVTLPSFHNDFAMYLECFSRWILEWTALLAGGESIHKYSA